MPADNEAIGSSIEETMSTNPCTLNFIPNQTSNYFSSLAIDTDPQSDNTSAIVITIGETTSTTSVTTSDSANITTEQANEPRRGDILPIVYDVQSIPTIGGGGSVPMNRGGPGRQQPRPSMTSMFLSRRNLRDHC